MDTQKRVADAPFNDTEPHDVILQSKDGVNFFVCKVILSFASPFFKEMFTLPQSVPPSIRAIETIPIVEDSQTMDRLLRLCYPVPDPIFEDLSDTSDVLEVAMKYEMDESTAIMRAALLSFVKDEPLQVYAAACRLLLEKEARAAAGSWKATCPKVDSTPNRRGTFPDWSSTSAAASYLPEMSAVSYFRLLCFVRGEEISSFTQADVRDNDGTSTPPVLHPLYYEGADIVLRSSDDVDFHVNKVIISFISSDLLNEPTESDNLPVFKVSEKGQILAMLLELCGPNGNPDAVTSVSFDVRVAILQAAQKYKCSNAVSLLKSQFTKEIKQNPLRVYFTAIQCNWKEGAQEAARCAAGRPIDDVYVPEMEFVSANVYNGLLKYCHSYRSVVFSICCRFQGGKGSSVFSGKRVRNRNSWNREYNSDEDTGNDTPSWWYLESHDEINIPVWVAIAAEQSRGTHYNSSYGHYESRDGPSQLRQIGKLAEKELSEVRRAPLLLSYEANPFAD
jgi:hypothetical protein